MLHLNTWIHKIQWHLNVVSYPISKLKTYQLSNYYCKIILNDQNYNKFFEDNYIYQDYHFLINSKNKSFEKTEKIFQQRKIENIYGVFIAGNKVFKIYFSPFFKN